ncbi:hypothetical protein DFH08DRAFT_808760 [Mycena albidolilacea]|uniref:Uncharacterized protein n=1 Tax=Mycena albidolilacea TaxID=1033008 RepID=A0AAD7ETC0_9AGAR|nr:hypothetical protein DFH08DRAFT_808760 [Mycena albidolilacea]
MAEMSKLVIFVSLPRLRFKIRTPLSTQLSNGWIFLSLVKNPHYAEHVPSTEEQEMWDQYQTDGATFTAGHDLAVKDEAQEANLVRQAEQFGRWNATSIARNLGFMDPESEIQILGEDDEEDALLCEMLDNAQLRDPPTIEDMVDIEIEGQSRVKSTAEWYPYPTKMVRALIFGTMKTESMNLKDVLTQHIGQFAASTDFKFSYESLPLDFARGRSM